MNHLVALPVQGHALVRASVRYLASLPGPEPVPPMPPMPPEDVPEPLDIPPQVPPEIREPALPGEHLPMGDDPSNLPRRRH